MSCARIMLSYEACFPHVCGNLRLKFAPTWGFWDAAVDRIQVVARLGASPCAGAGIASERAAATRSTDTEIAHHVLRYPVRARL